MYRLWFRGYYKEKMGIEEQHLFTELRDLYAHAAWLMTFNGPYECYDHYDIRIELAEIDPMPPAA